MAEAFNEVVVIKKEESFSYGHRVYYHFEVDNLDRRGIYVLDQDFLTRCESCPTLWKFRMVFTKIEAYGVVSTPLALQRFDSMNCEVNASINVALSNEKCYTFCGTPINAVKPRMGPGDHLFRVACGVLKPLWQIPFFNEMLTIRAIVEIRECHSVDNALHAK